ncbi:O-antigen ligase family protein [Thalassospira tepidiphila]|uniref:O-antigen ligase family protein n=1 Tax=Thalassospira tepidiphila TaxID=393657 RepID=UPI003AA7D18D
MNIAKHRTAMLGTIVSLATTLAFCQLSTQGQTFSLNGIGQYSFIVSIFFICFVIISKSPISQIKFSTEHFLICGLFFAISLSILDTDHTLTSSKRLAVMASATLIVFITANFAEKPQSLFIGFSIGIITVTTISVLYSLIAALSDFNLINQGPYEIVKFEIFGIELQQTIAHREYKIDGSAYNIQRYAGIFPNPNGLGLMSGISFTLAYLLFPLKKAKYIIQAICLIGLVISLSRMGFLLCATSFIYYNAHNTLIRRVICFAMIAGLLSFLFVMASSFDPASELRNQNNYFSNIEVFQLREREYLIQRAWLGFLENWPLGVGFGVGAEYLFPDNAENIAIHSALLNAALETGILGATFLIATWLFPIFATKVDPSRDDGSDHARHVIASLLFGLFFAEAFDLSVMRFHYIHLIFFFLLGIWSALGRDSKDTAIQDAQYSDTPNTVATQLESSERPDR